MLIKASTQNKYNTIKDSSTSGAKKNISLMRSALVIIAASAIKLGRNAHRTAIQNSKKRTVLTLKQTRDD